MCGSPSFGEASSVEGKRVRACLETCGVFAVSPWCGQQIAVCLIIGNLLVGFTGCESAVCLIIGNLLVGFTGCESAVCLIIGNLLVGFTGCESLFGKVTFLKVGSCWLISL